MIKIYCLQDAEGRVRYIGKTERPLATRLRAHMQRAKGTEVYHLQRWLRSLPAPPTIEVLEWCIPELWEAQERYWIALARDYGCDLVNTTEGGDARPNNFGRKATPEHCEKISRAQKGRKKSKEEIENNRWSEARREVMRAKLSGENNPMFGRPSTFLGRKHTPEAIAKQRAIKLGKKMPPRSLAFRAAMSVRMSGAGNPMFGRPSSFQGRKHTPEARALMGRLSGKTRTGQKRGPYKKAQP